MNTIYRASNGCFYTDDQVWHYYETGFWRYKDRRSAAPVQIVETSSGGTVTLVPTSFDTFPFDLPGTELKN